ncbi:TPA: hypothetical protein ACPVZG_000410 [Vibrio parahaemolyticus]
MSNISASLKSVVAATALTIVTGCTSLSGDYKTSYDTKSTQAFDQSISDILSHEKDKLNVGELKESDYGWYLSSKFEGKERADRVFSDLKQSKALLMDNPIKGATDAKILLLTVDANQRDVDDAIYQYYGQVVKTDLGYEAPSSKQQKSLGPQMTTMGGLANIELPNGDKEVLTVHTSIVGERAFENVEAQLATMEAMIEKRDYDVDSILSKYTKSDLANSVPEEVRKNNFRQLVFMHELAHSFAGEDLMTNERFRKRLDLQTAGNDYEYSPIELSPENETERVHIMMDTLGKISGHSDFAVTNTLNGEIVADITALSRMSHVLKDNEWEAVKTDLITMRAMMDTDLYKRKLGEDNPELKGRLDHETLPVILPVIELLDKNRKSPSPAIDEITSDMTRSAIFAYVINSEIQNRNGKSVAEIISDNDDLTDIIDELKELEVAGQKILSTNGGLNHVIDRVNRATPDHIADDLPQIEIGGGMSLPEIEASLESNKLEANSPDLPDIQLDSGMSLEEMENMVGEPDLPEIDLGNGMTNIQMEQMVKTEITNPNNGIDLSSLNSKGDSPEFVFKGEEQISNLAKKMSNQGKESTNNQEIKSQSKLNI